MNVLFLTLVGFETINDRNIYTDLLREFIKNGHYVYVVSPIEKKYKKKTCIIEEGGATILRLQIGNTQKTNIIEKGISTILLESTFKHAIKNYFSGVRFDLILYSTPPITLVSAIEFIKKRDEAKTYLLLKDIFPQNAVDIELMKTTGVKGLIYKYFRRKEKKLYKISDRIGCMSQANVEYVITHNPEVNPSIVEVCPNSIEVINKSVDEETKKTIRIKYGIPLDKKVFVYGGNLGKPQGIPFLIECLEKCQDINDAFFLIVGNGTEYNIVADYVNNSSLGNVKLMKGLPKEDYDSMVGACDVGMIFLDYRFTIPNYPSRLLAYMQSKIPVLAVTDPNTDIGKNIVDGGFGWWCESNDSNAFKRVLQNVFKCNTEDFQEKEFNYLIKHFSVLNSYNIIVKGLELE